MSSFERIKIKDFVTFKTGKLDSNAAENDGKYPFFTCAQQTLRINKHAFDTECVLLAGNNAAGIFPLKYYKGKFNAYQRTYIIEPIDINKLYIRYIYYALRPFLKQFEQSATGVTTKFLTLGIMNNLYIPLPSPSIQKKIAAVLSTYDDLIENNNRRIAILEKMAEEIYREWFVRMRFPGHEKVKFHKGVPEGWEVEKLGNFINLIMGQSPKSEFYNTQGEGLPFNQGVGTYGYRFPKKQTFCSVNGRTAKKGDILFSVRAPVGRLNVADCKMIIGRGLSSINHRNGYDSYLYYMLKCYFSDEDIIGNGTIFNSVGKDELKKLEIIYPVESLIKQYNHIAVDLDSKIENLLNSIDLLVKSRDLLLTRLLSGKLSVENLNIQIPPGMEEADA